MNKQIMWLYATEQAIFDLDLFFLADEFNRVGLVLQIDLLPLKY